MSSSAVALVVCASMSVLACAVTGTQAAPSQRPPDFRVVYDWTEGSLPPPYHYEYTVTVEPDGRGQIVFVPDYGGEGVPKWTETFTVPAGRLDDVYRLMMANGLLKTRWRQLEMPPVGGSSESVRVTVSGRQVTVADYLVKDQQAAGERMFTAARALVPDTVMTGLKARRDDYVKKHERR